MSETLSNLDRRTVANLAMPRNVEELTHELRVDPFTVTRGEADVHEHLGQLVKRGLVVPLGETESVAALVAKLPRKAREVHDEQAEIHVRRVAHPTREWRARGDLYIVSRAGIEALRYDDNPPPPMEPSQVQALVDGEWARTLKDMTIDRAQGDDKWDETLGSRLLQDEFTAWFEQVADECERVWNVRPRAPMAGGTGWSDVVENRIVDWENQKTATPTLVAPWFMALVILALTDSDTPTTCRDGTHIPTYTGYAEKSVAAADMNAASSGSSTNANAITFAACTAGSSVIVGYANKETNSTTGDLRKYGTCSSTTVSTTQTPATFSAGSYTTTAD